MHSWTEIIPRELQKGNRLSFKEASVDLETLAIIRDVSVDPEMVRKLLSDVREQKETLAQSMIDASEEFEELAAQKWSSNELKASRKDLIVSSDVINTWYQDLYTDATRRIRAGLSPSSKLPNLTNLPCTRAYIGINVALAYKRHRDGRKYKPNDMYDAKHYVSSAMTDGLATDDGALHKVSSMIEWKRIPLIRSTDLSALLESNGKLPLNSAALERMEVEL